MYVVILAGGSGTRFWPLSRKRNPKQLMSVFGGRSMLQRTVDRVLLLHPKRVLVVTNTLQAAETTSQLSEYGDRVRIDIIEEPVGRNTAPAIGLAASLIASHSPEGLMLVLPADHFIADEETFAATVAQGKEAALNGQLVTMGIVPTRPETGYGYIEAETKPGHVGPFPVKRFVEKPPLDKALEFLAAGNFYWNSGMFLWRADVILDQIARHMPALTAALARLVFSADIWETADLKTQIAGIYADIASESIDYGVMEKVDNAVVVPAAFGWSDVGSWSALPEVLPADENGNVVLAAAGTETVAATGCVVSAPGRMVVLIGVTDLVVVATDDALLVCAKDVGQDVKTVVENLGRKGCDEFL